MSNNLLQIELGVFGEENDLENRNQVVDALCQKRSRRHKSCCSVEPASSVLEHGPRAAQNVS